MSATQGAVSTRFHMPVEHDMNRKKNLGVITSMTKNPFDFSDMSDLPVELAAKLTAETNGNVDAFVGVVQKAAEFGLNVLEINQITAGAIRMGIEVPTQQTVRNYLNAAVSQGKLAKPTRQTYSLPGAVEADEAAETAETADDLSDI